MRDRKSSGEDIARTLDDPVTVPSVLDAPTFSIFSDQIGSSPIPLTELKGKVSPSASVAAVILAGGQGSRFGQRGGKQLFDLLGRPVLTWSAEVFDATPEVGLIVIVCPEEDTEEFCKHAIDPYPFVTPIVFAPSGEFRQESAFNGVNAVPEEFTYIAMHDGARPLVTPELIKHALNMIKGTADSDGAIIGHPAVDTLKVVGDNLVVGTPDRAMFWVAQTPQIFFASILRRAHREALAAGFIGTDDSSLVERIGGMVLLVEGPRDNIKVTVPEDFGPVEAALKRRLSVR